VRLLLALILMVPMLASGAVVRLTDCGTLPGSISEGSPFDLDACNLQNGDDIALLMDDVVAEWGAVHLRAPSATRNVIYTGTQTFTGIAFTFVEDQSARNRLSIAHVPDDFDAKMWVLTNLTSLRVGGTNLSMTFVGTHPGLGTGKPCSGTRETCDWQTQVALIEVRLTDSSNPALADFRANCWMTWSSCLLFFGGAAGSDGENTVQRWQQLNLAGMFMSSGAQVTSGVMDVWVDPDRTVTTDPWNRVAGWDGEVAGVRGDGIPVGCVDNNRAMLRTGPGIGFQYARRIEGGITAEYGHISSNAFVPKYMGNSRADPYIVRFRDYGFSGPEALTGYPSGTMTKAPFGGIMKNDPAPAYSMTEAFRFVRFIQLPPRYGNGVQMGPITQPCATGNTTNNNTNTGSPFIWIAEASRDQVAAQYVNAWFEVTLQGITQWTDMANSRSYVRAACEGADASPGPTTPDRCHNNTLRATLGTSVPGSIPMLDNTTLTGPGSWYAPVIEKIVASPDVDVNPIDNSIINTHIHGFITVGISASNTVVHNVDFTNAAATILTVGAGSDVALSDLCVPSGKQITGSGTVTLDGGSALTLPYTFGSTLTDCNITEEGPPDPPGVP
jgi:hypothetical protein